MAVGRDVEGQGDSMTNKTGKRRRAGRRDFGSIYADGTTSDPRHSVMWWEGGKRRRKRGFRTRTEAEAFLARVRTALSDGVLDAHRRSEVTLAAVADEWLRTHSAVKLRSHSDNIERWRRFTEFFGPSAAICEVTPSRILELREALNRAGYAPATVNRYLALLRTHRAQLRCDGRLPASVARAAFRSRRLPLGGKPSKALPSPLV
jgi:hypothetical protein